jgi:hypothetical protein
MLLQLYTKLNLELVHQHARQLKPVVYYKKNCCLLTFVRRQCRGAGIGVAAARGGRTNRGQPPERGGVAAANPPSSPCLRSGAPSPGLRRGATDDEQERATAGRQSAFFPSQVFSPLLKRRWAGPIRFLIFNFVNTKQFGLLIFQSS